MSSAVYPFQPNSSGGVDACVYIEFRIAGDSREIGKVGSYIESRAEGYRCGRGKIFYWKLENIADAKTDQRFRFHGSLSLVIFVYTSFPENTGKNLFFHSFFFYHFIVIPLLSFVFLSFSYICFIRFDYSKIQIDRAWDLNEF